MKTPKATPEVFLLGNRDEDDVEDIKLGSVIKRRPSPNGEACLPVGRDKRMRSKQNRITERTSVRRNPDSYRDLIVARRLTT